MAERARIKSDVLPLKIILTILSIFILTTPAEAFFRHLCFNPLGNGRIDPIMSPGAASQHVHQLHGSSNLGIHSVDGDYLLEANCTSCSITVDKSAYWAPAMYFHHANGTFELMTTSGGVTVYYKTEKRVNFVDRNYTAFPKGFRMIAGNNERRDWVGPWPVPQQSWWYGEDITQPALASKALGFNCLNYVRGWDEPTFAFPYMRNKTFIDETCLQGVRAEILFPSCWDGVNLDSPDHKSHMAYPTLLQDGACPDTHPVFLPIMFFETVWNTQDFKGVPGEFVFANGDPTGYGYHGDFIAAWEDGVLEQVMSDPTCTDQNINDRHSDGIQEHCPVFAAKIQSEQDAAQCKLEVPEILAHEKVDGLVDALPGGVKITGVQHEPVPVPRAGSSVVTAVSTSTFVPLTSTIAAQPPPPPPPPPASSPSPVSSAPQSSTPYTNTTVPSLIPPKVSMSVPLPTSPRPPPVATTPTVPPPAPAYSSALATFVSPTPANPAVENYSTSYYTSGGTKYEMDVVVESILLKTTVTPTVTATVIVTPTVTAIITPRHVHGGGHFNAH